MAAGRLIHGVARLLDSLRAAGARADQAAAQATLGNPACVARELDRLLDSPRAGARRQGAALADRAAAHAPLDNPYNVARLLAILRKAGAHEQAATLADRAQRRWGAQRLERARVSLEVYEQALQNARIGSAGPTRRKAPGNGQSRTNGDLSGPAGL